MHDEDDAEPQGPCPLCESIAWRSPVPLDGPWISRGHGVAIPARGHLVAGHMLVCSSEHYANLLSSPVEVQADLLELVTDVRHRLTAAFGMECFAFEHGLVGRNKAEIGCGIDHVHLHVLPLPEAVITKARGWIEAFAVLGANNHVDPQRYLLGHFADSEKWFVSGPEQRIRHRHFLKLVDEELGRTSRWDEAVVDSAELIASAFEALDMGPTFVRPEQLAAKASI